MLWDIGRLISGEGDTITVPDPVYGFAPMPYVSIYDAVPLSPRPLTLGVPQAVSRRVQSYNMRNMTDITSSMADNVSDYSIDDVASVHENLDDTIEHIQSNYTSPVSEVQHADDVVQDVIPETSSEPDVSPVINVSRRRRMNMLS